jgi:ribosomal protein eS8
MGISRDSRHKRRATGGRKANLKKKRLYESGRPPAMTKLGPKRIHELRVRGGNIKQRALRLDTGNFSWGSEGECGIARVFAFSPPPPPAHPFLLRPPTHPPPPQLSRGRLVLST